MQKVVSKINDFLKLESASGIILMFAALLALIVANSGWGDAYAGFLSDTFGLYFGGEEILAKPMIKWVNDGLMALFFFLVGLEIKREVLEGELSNLRKSALPLFAALGGVALPALIYVAINSGDAAALDGWAIPAATDIAFALGVIALLGDRVPSSLKILLLAIAIIDDLAAILIIALFYTDDLSLTMLLLSGLGMVGLAALNLRGVTKLAPYVLIGLFVWFCVLKSGIHATLAGVVVAMAIPLKGKEGESSPLHHAEHGLHPWIAYGVLPIFAFANAGVSFEGVSFSALAEPIPLGVVLGLFVGKQVGVFGASYAAVKLGLAERPGGASWLQVYAVAILCGIGFTMSLFIATLGLSDPQALNGAKLGILIGSLISALAGFFLLKTTLAPAKTATA